MRICRKLLLYSLLPAILAAFLHVPPAAGLDLGDRSLLVWGGRDGQGGYSIRISQFRQGKWAEAQVLASGAGQNILPAVAADEQGNIWAAWIELHGMQGAIRYSFSVGDQWSEPASLETPTNSDMAPSMTIDADGKAWLVYSGNDGSQDDVYSVYWTGEAWSEPLRINSEDEYPDIQPRITMGDDGRPVASWQGYNGSRYVPFISRWNGHGWSLEEELAGSGAHIRHRTDSSLSPEEQHLLLNKLPDSLIDTSRAVLHLYRNGKGEIIKLNGLR